MPSHVCVCDGWAMRCVVCFVRTALDKKETEVCELGLCGFPYAIFNDTRPPPHTKTHTFKHSRPETRSPDDLTPALTQRHRQRRRRRRSHKRLWPCPAICYGVDRRTHLCGVHCFDVCVFNVAGAVFLMIACARVFSVSHSLSFSLTVSALCCLLLTYAHVARFCLVAIMHTGTRARALA